MEELRQAIESRRARIGVIGLGYVGLPLAMHFAEAGFPVLGYDADPAKVDLLSRGRSYIEHIDAARLAALGDRFAATGSVARLGSARVIIICVPTPLTENRDPDMRYVERAAREIAGVLKPGMLVSLESTTYPGTTAELVRPLLESGGRRAGHDFFLVYSPEREDPGNSRFTMKNVPKVVGGFSERCLQLGTALYGAVAAGVVPVSTLATAEAAKLLENIYRAVNIALVNELKILFARMGIDVWEVIAASKTKPFGFQAFYPGPGLGGHCIPIDPFYLTWKARQYDFATRFIELAGEINTAMPAYVVGRLADALNEAGKPLNGARVLLLGAAYKKDVGDMRESPALKLISLLRAKKAQVMYSDPHVPVLGKTRRDPGAARLRSRRLTPALLRGLDAAVVVTDHAAFDYRLIARHAPLIVDTRHVFPAGTPRVVSA